MGDMHPGDFHKIIRSWLLAEDPYGMNQQGQPSMGTVSPPGAPASGGAESAPSAPAPPGRNPIAQGAGENAVASALTPASNADALRAQNYGRGAVDRELQKPPTPNVKSEAFQGARDPRAQAQGEQAVRRATGPSPTAEVDRTRGQAWGESAVDKALNPPTGSGGGFWMPGEAADTASAVGEEAVGSALAQKARSKMARGRLKDPQDPDDRQPE
jgi:hypothetical protein